MTGNVKRNSCPQSGKSLVNKLTNFMSAKQKKVNQKTLKDLMSQKQNKQYFLPTTWKIENC